MKFIDLKDLKLKVEDLGVEITKLLDIEHINAIAKATGFTQRESGKINGFKFLDMILFTHFNQKKLSLNNMCVELIKRYGVHLMPQSLNERFNGASVIFFKRILAEAINLKIKNNIDIDFTSYNRVLIKDATSFQLPKEMEEKYRGTGGSASPSCIKIQFEYNLKSGEITDLSLHSYTEQDSTNARETIDNVQNGDLIIRDLGYVVIDLLAKINCKGAYYLNRLGGKCKCL